MKICFGMIVFNGDFVLRQTLEQIYPFAEQILIAEGPVEYWKNQGHKVSFDDTNKILYDFPDPEGKIHITHGPYTEKDDQCNAYMTYLKDDIDYLFQIDSDEVYKTEDLKKILAFLEEERPDSVGVRPLSFYGGFDFYVGGFEQNTDNFLRIFRVRPGSKWITHRPPTMGYAPEYRHYPRIHVSSDELYNKLGVSMYHYSYVFASQVQAKMKYYETKVAKNKIIPDYFWKVWLPWTTTDLATQKKIEESGGVRLVESLYCGVHEFLPEFRGDAYTQKFAGKHPEAVERDLGQLKERLEKELKDYV